MVMGIKQIFCQILFCFILKFRLRVTGGFPVKVEYITPNGAAFVAGVCEGTNYDTIYGNKCKLLTFFITFRRLHPKGVFLLNN